MVTRAISEWRSVFDVAFVAAFVILGARERGWGSDSQASVARHVDGGEHVSRRFLAEDLVPPLTLSLDAPPEWIELRDATEQQAEAPTLSGRIEAVDPFRAGSAASVVPSRPTYATQGRVEDANDGTWSLEWAGEFLLASGAALSEEGALDAQRTRLDRFVLGWDFSGHGAVRAGRYTPPEAPPLGPLDGVQGELQVGDALRIGAVAGIKTRSTDTSRPGDPRGAAYVATRMGDPSTFEVRGQVALMGVYDRDGEDRLALYVQQAATILKNLRLSASSEIDIEPLSEDQSGDGGLSTTHLTAFALLGPYLTVRAGLDQWEANDVGDDARVQEVTGEELRRRDSVAYRVGGSQKLPWQLRLDGDVSFLESQLESARPHVWRGSLTRQGLPSLPEASVTAAVSRFNEPPSSSYEAIVAAAFAIPEEALSIRPALRVAWEESAGAPQNIHLADLSLYVRWQPLANLVVQAGLTHAFHDATERVLVEAGVQLRW